MVASFTKLAQDEPRAAARLPAHGDDHLAWADFLERYTPLLHKWARQLESQEADAQDLVQEVLLLLHQKLPQFRCDPQRSFRGWLRAILVNKWRDRRRCRRRSRVQPMDPRAMADMAATSSGARVIDEDSWRHLFQRAEHRIRAEFTEKNWKAFWETSVEGRSAREVGAELALSLGAVYQAASRVRRGLRRQLAETLACGC